MSVSKRRNASFSVARADGSSVPGSATAARHHASLARRAATRVGGTRRAATGSLAATIG